MNTLTATSVVLPAPRPAINQGIDINNEMVLNHTAIYENCLAQVTQENTVENALMLLDPYGTAPGVWNRLRSWSRSRMRQKRRCR